jgi:hypothetical protein
VHCSKRVVMRIFTFANCSFRSKSGSTVPASLAFHPVHRPDHYQMHAHTAETTDNAALKGSRFLRRDFQRIWLTQMASLGGEGWFAPSATKDPSRPSVSFSTRSSLPLDPTSSTDLINEKASCSLPPNNSLASGFPPSHLCSKRLPSANFVPTHFQGGYQDPPLVAHRHLASPW